MSLKEIYCPIHGYIKISPLAQKILDTFEFQRLRDIKQLGATYFVYPSANHSRLEHSIGVYYLTGKLINKIKENQPNIKFDSSKFELIKIAGLIHDIGHGPFSHLYDTYIADTTHESRSINIFKNMIKKYNLPISTNDFDFISNCINPSKSIQNIWYYQIISNQVNGIDVDKIDYILRDSFHIGISVPFNKDFERIFDVIITENDSQSFITYNYKSQFDIFNLFLSRYRLNKLVYNHHSVKAFEYLIIPILKDIKQSNINFINLTDSYILSNFNNKYTNIINNIYTRNTPKFINEITIQKKHIISKFNNPSYYQGIIDLFHLHNIDFNQYILEKINLGFGNFDSNPLNNIFYYTNKDLTHDIFNGLSTDYSFVIPQNFSELNIKLFSKNNDLISISQGNTIWKFILHYLEH